MTSSLFPVVLSSFINDFPKKFWNGDGSLSFSGGELTDIIESSPDITLKELKRQRQSSRQSMLLDSGISINLDHQNLLALSGGLGVRAMVVLDESLLDLLPQEQYPGLKDLLENYIISNPDESLVLLLIPGKANAALNGSHMFSPAVSAGFQLKGGGDIEYYYCCPIKNDEALLPSLKTLFGTARLPQTAGLAVPLQKNEILYTAYSGFLHLGGDVSFGYSFNGSKEYSLGELNLTSKLLVQAAIKLQFRCQLTGAFKLIATAGRSQGWRRVVVEKDHSSTFDFALGVTVDANLSTDETPQPD